MSDFDRHAESAVWYLDQASANSDHEDIAGENLRAAQVQATLAVGAALQAIADELQARNEG